eukprot:819296_1
MCNEHDRIHQSSGFDAQDSEQVRVIASLEKTFKWKGFVMIPMNYNCNANGDRFIKDITQFDNVLYDESFGISGRLLVRCTMKDSKKCIFYQCFNWSELMPLSRELKANEYCLMPGMNKKPFNLIVFVFEMLYGSDIIDAYIESPRFNPAYDEEVTEKISIAMNKLLTLNSKCLISVDG